jgi:hypothetical protein
MPNKLAKDQGFMPVRNQLINPSLSLRLRQNNRPYGYRGLKIFTSLKLRFQDFQRQHLKELAEIMKLRRACCHPGIGGRVKFLPLAWAGMPKTSFRKNSDSPLSSLLPFFLGFLHRLYSITTLRFGKLINFF